MMPLPHPHARFGQQLHSSIYIYSSHQGALSKYSSCQVLVAPVPPLPLSGLGELWLPTIARPWVHPTLFGSLNPVHTSGKCLFTKLSSINPLRMPRVFCQDLG